MSSSEKSVVSDELPPSLDQRSRLIVFPRDIAIPSAITGIKGVRKIGAGIFVAERGNKILRKALEEIPQIRFRKARDIPKGDARRMKPFAEKTYAIVHYSFKGVTPQQKKKVQRLFLQAPCIKLRPGVILFPYLRSRQKSRYYQLKDGTSLMDSKTFATEARKIGVEVLRWTRLKITNQESNQYVEQAFRFTVKTDLEALEKKVKDYLIELTEGTEDIKKLKPRYTIITSRFKKIKRNLTVLKAVWEFDAEKELKRTYNMTLRVKRKLQEMGI